MVLLTSSQVSVVISAAIIVTFTTALFLSGYVLQQHTLRDLREAIKPQLIPTPPELQFYLPPQFRDQEVDQRGIVDVVSRDEGSEDGEDNMIGATRWQKQAAQRKKESEKQKETGEEKGEEKTLSRAERRKKIKEEILLAGEGEGFKGYKRRMW